MALWSEVEFQRIVAGTEFNDRTLAACHDVLVEGYPNKDAALRNGMFPGHSSRSVNKLRDRQAELIKTAMELSSVNSLYKFTAKQVALNLMPFGSYIVDAEPGYSYEGPIIGLSPGFVIQKVGTRAFLHEEGKLDAMPKSRGIHTITFSAAGDKATVVEKAVEVSVGLDKSSGVGR